MQVWLSGIAGRVSLQVDPSTTTVASLVQLVCPTLGLPSAQLCSAIFRGRVLDPAATLAAVQVAAGDHLVVLQTRSPPPAARPAASSAAAVGGRPLFDPSAVSGMLAQLNLQLQHGQAQAGAAAAAAMTPRHEALLRQLMDMGFSRNRSERAMAAEGLDLERCSQWLVETIDDAALELPLRPPPPEPQPSPAIQRCIQRGVCTLSATGTRFQPQKFYQCFSCEGLHGTGGLCASCVKQCHRGHRVDEGRWAEGCYCDCGTAPSCRCRDVVFDPEDPE